MNGSVRLSFCLSVRPSVCHTFLTMFPSLHHHEIFRSYYQWQRWRPCKRSRSKVKVTEVNTQLSRFRTLTPDSIHIWWWNDAQSLMLFRRAPMATKWSTKIELAWERCPIHFQGYPSNFKVSRLRKSSILTQIGRFRTVTPAWIHQWLRNDAQSLN